MPPESANRGTIESELKLADRQRKRVVKCTYGLIVTSVFHPFQYVKVLIQLGHEPMPLVRKKQYVVFGKESFILPGAFKYVRHIYQQDGFSGLYNGLGPCFCGNFAAAVTSFAVNDYLDLHWPKDLDDNAVDVDPEWKSIRICFKKTLRESICKCAGIIVARPFQVIMIRYMAQFIGRENSYSNVITSIGRVNNEHGARGLFAGLVPQLIGEMCILWSTACIFYMVERAWLRFNMDQEQIEDGENDESMQILSDLDEEPTEKSTLPKIVRTFVDLFAKFVVNPIFYRYQLVSTVMAVNGSGLEAGQMPFIPIFANWQECYEYLADRQQLMRGARLFFRFYNGPLTYRRGKPFAALKFKE